MMNNYLPALNGMSRELRKGRCPFEGSQRGWGLLHGDLKAKILADGCYQRAIALSQGRSVMSEYNRLNIYLIMQFFLRSLPFGHVVEYGSYRGGNAIFMASVARELYPGMKVFALDTFEGMPKTDPNIDLHGKGDFSGASHEELSTLVESLGLDNLVVVRGAFEDTNASVVAEAGAVSMAHIDCDIAASVRFAYEGVKPHLVEGGYIVFDDATVPSCLGATEVVEDLLIRRDGLNSEQIWPHFVFRNFSARS